MQLVQGAVLDLNPPPDRGPGVEQRDLELVDPLRGRDGADAPGAVERPGVSSVTCRSELRIMPVLACA